MKNATLTCIGCPMGCRLTAMLENGAVVSVDGAGCARGVAYARQECVCPTRTVTTRMRIRGRRSPLCVKTAHPIPKEKIFECLFCIHAAEAVPPVRIGDVVVCNVCGTGVDAVATMEVGRDGKVE